MNKVLLFLMLVSLIVLPQIVSAAPLDLNLKYPSFGGIDINTKEGQSLPAVIAWFYSLIVSISGLAAFVMLVWGGVQWLSSAGNTSVLTEAKDRIQKALLGLGIVLSSVLIMNIINPAAVGPFSLELETVNIATGGLIISDVGIASGGLPDDAGLGGWGDGVFLCKNENCEGEGGVLKTDGNNAVYAPFPFDPPNSWCNIPPPSLVLNASGDETGIYPDVTKCISSDGKDWGTRTKSIGVKGGYDIVLYSKSRVDPPDDEGAEGFNKAICFTNGSSRLDSFRIGDDDGWNKKTRELHIKEDGFCKIPGLTVDRSAFVGAQPVAFFFEELTWGEDIKKKIERGYPSFYLFSGSLREERFKDIQSIRIEDSDYAVKVWENSNGSGKFICYTGNQPDISGINFGDDEKPDLLPEKNRGFEVLLKEQCPVKNQVL